MIEWKLCDENELPNLERRLLDIINQLLDYEVPIGHKDETNNNVKKSKKDSVETRKLTKDFADIDFEDEVPDYYRSVRRLLDITHMKVLLHTQYCKQIIILTNIGEAY